MGAWGTAVLEDDTALDFMEEQLLAAEAPLHVMRGSFEAALAAEYVDYEVGHAVLVSATALRALQKGEPFKDEEQEEWAAWRQAHARLDTDSVKNPAAQACLKVAAAQSELNALWAENEELYPEWKTGVESLASAVGS